MHLIEMKNIKKDYYLGEVIVHALKRVDLTLDKGEFVALWGPSGSGKTTLLNIIGTIDKPTEGNLYYNGDNINALNDNMLTEFRNKHIGFIFQSFNLIPVLSALENVMIPLQINGVPFDAAKEKAMKRLQDVQLEEFVNHRPDKLSGGQQQRVAIARALIANPSIIIADEPTANLDSATSQRIMDLMRELNEKEQTTFVFSTHDQRILGQVDRLINLSDGKIQIKDEKGATHG